MKNLTEKYKAIEVDGFTVQEVTTVNHRPHPFTIGAEHVAFASDHYSGILGDACMNDKRFPPCAMRGCNLRPDEHTSDTVMAVKLTKNLSQEEARQSLQQYIDAGMEDDGIDGFVFIETEEKFRIEEPDDA